MIFVIFGSNPYHDYPRPCIVTVTHVCRAWRSIALNCSALWSDIDFFYGDAWASESLLRARHYPLSVSSIAWDFPTFFHLKKVLATQMPQIRSFFFFSIWEDSITEIGEPSQLLDLHLDLPETWGNSSKPFIKLIEGSDSSLLQRLALTVISWPWQSMRHPNLTHLTLDLNEYEIQIEPIMGLLSSLRQMPLLQYMSLSRCDMVELPGLQSEHIVSLPNLRTLHFTSPLIPAISFLNCLSLPTTADLYLQTRIDFPLDSHQSIVAINAQPSQAYKFGTLTVSPRGAMVTLDRKVAALDSAKLGHFYLAVVMNYPERPYRAMPFLVKTAPLSRLQMLDITEKHINQTFPTCFPKGEDGISSQLLPC